MVADRARETRSGVRALQPGGRAGRAGLRRAQRGLRRRAETLARAAQFDEELVLCDLELAPRPAAGRSERTSRESMRRRWGQAPLLARLHAPAAERRGGAAARRAAEPVAEVYRGAEARPARLRAQERLRARAGRGLRRDRLGARRRDRSRRARPGARELRRHALPALQRRDAGRRAGDRARLGAELVEIPIEGAMHAYEKLLAASETVAAPGTGAWRRRTSRREFAATL